jgi:hypothetical protein
MTIVSMTWLEGQPRSRQPERRDVVRGGRTPYVVGSALAATVALAAGSTVVFPSLLRGVAVSNGNLRGTAVALLAAGLPVLIVAMIGTAGGSARAFVVWLGTLGYLIYQAVLLCFATPLNNLFLLYVGYLGSAVWFGSHADPTSPVSSMSMVPVFAVVAVITAGFLALFLRAVDRTS